MIVLDASGKVVLYQVGHFEVNQKKGVRWNASKAMLRPVLHRPNLKVVTGALAFGFR